MNTSQNQLLWAFFIAAKKSSTTERVRLKIRDVLTVLRTAEHHCNQLLSVTSMNDAHTSHGAHGHITAKVFSLRSKI